MPPLGIVYFQLSTKEFFFWGNFTFGTNGTLPSELFSKTELYLRNFSLNILYLFRYNFYFPLYEIKHTLTICFFQRKNKVHPLV